MRPNHRMQPFPWGVHATGCNWGEVWDETGRGGHNGDLVRS